MEKRFKDGDKDFKPNTRTHTSVIDAWAKSGEKGAAKRAEQILNAMISRYEVTGDQDVKPNVHTANAVCNVRKLVAMSHLCPVYKLTFSCSMPFFKSEGLCLYESGRG
jgi:hypothetical protein